MTDQEKYGGDQGGLLIEQARPKLKKPPVYKVILINDDYTPMEFVVIVLMRFFRMTPDNAEQVMINVHTKGIGVCGVFPREIAETKVQHVLQYSRENRHPLQCAMEPD